MAERSHLPCPCFEPRFCLQFLEPKDFWDWGVTTLGLPYYCNKFCMFWFCSKGCPKHLYSSTLEVDDLLERILLLFELAPSRLRLTAEFSLSSNSNSLMKAEYEGLWLSIAISLLISSLLWSFRYICSFISAFLKQPELLFCCSFLIKSVLFFLEVGWENVPWGCWEVFALCESLTLF